MFTVGPEYNYFLSKVMFNYFLIICAASWAWFRLCFCNPGCWDFPFLSPLRETHSILSINSAINWAIIKDTGRENKGTMYPVKPRAGEEPWVSEDLGKTESSRTWQKGFEALPFCAALSHRGTEGHRVGEDSGQQDKVRPVHRAWIPSLGLRGVLRPRSRNLVHTLQRDDSDVKVSPDLPCASFYITRMWADTEAEDVE